MIIQKFAFNSLKSQIFKDSRLLKEWQLEIENLLKTKVSDASEDIHLKWSKPSIMSICLTVTCKDELLQQISKVLKDSYLGYKI